MDPEKAVVRIGLDGGQNSFKVMASIFNPEEEDANDDDDDDDDDNSDEGGSSGSGDGSGGGGSGSEGGGGSGDGGDGGDDDNYEGSKDDEDYGAGSDKKRDEKPIKVKVAKRQKKRHLDSGVLSRMDGWMDRKRFKKRKKDK